MTDTEELAADAQRIAALALAEDGQTDITSAIAVSPGQQAVAVIEAREALVLAGRCYADAVAVACGIAPIIWRGRDGDALAAGAEVGTLAGDLAAMLRAERPLLNLLQRACGIATLTRRYVDAVRPARCIVLHTRKTTPGLRRFEVAAVQAGGGALHRRDLSHAVMIKDNHWHAMRDGGRSLADALSDAAARGIAERSVEVETLEQLDAACAAGATRLLIDNQAPEVVQRWAARARRHDPAIEIEATGGITLANVGAYAAAGIDYVSIGALTHSVPAVDIALEVRRQSRGR